MDSDKHKDSGEMYSPDDHGEYTLMDEAPQFSMQGLSDTLVEVRGETEDTPTEEYTMMLEVTMALVGHDLLHSRGTRDGYAHIES